MAMLGIDFNVLVEHKNVNNLAIHFINLYIFYSEKKKEKKKELMCLVNQMFF